VPGEISLRQFFLNNKWWGKLLGCFFGFLIAGPIGALFGLLIGNFFDKGLAAHFARAHWSHFTEEEAPIQDAFLEGLFSSMGHLAKASGRVSENHIQMAEDVMREMLLSQTQKKLAKQAFNEGKKPGFQLNTKINLLKTTCKNNLALLQLYMTLCYRIARVDGLSTKKIHLLNELCKQLGFSPLHQQYRFYEEAQEGYQRQQSSNNYQHNYQHNYRQYDSPNKTESLAESYAILGVNQGASQQEVKRAYRRMITRNHPDKLIAKGLPEDMIKKANDMTQKITKAYQRICAAKQW